MKLRPVMDKIVVKQKDDSEDTVTESGLILPDTVSDGTLCEGTVISTGKGIYSVNGTLIPTVVDVGDTILYSKNNGGQEYKLNGEELMIMSQNEVLSILED
tara:strand:+ start:148 stop:450 length:303 start_codon:yes stop_codon:yes gene_type:complete